MDNAKSLAVAAYRCEDPVTLERIGKGFDVHAWGMIVALLGCILGPMFLHGWISFEAFGLVVAITLSTISAILLTSTSRADIWQRPPAPMKAAAMAIGSGAVVVPAVALRMDRSEHVQLAMLAFFVLAGLFWFSAQCSKLHLLEYFASAAPGGEIARRARTLRHGTYVMFAIVAIGLMPAVFRQALAYLDVPFILMLSVGLLVFTLLSVLLYSRMSAALRQQARFSRVVRECMGIVDPRLLPDEPDWDVPDLCA